MATAGPLVHQLAKFLFSGGIAALANAGVGLFLRHVLVGPSAYNFSIAGGFSIGLVVSFVLNRSITFAATEEHYWPQFGRFVLAGLLGLGIAALIARVCLRLISLVVADLMPPSTQQTLAHIASIGLMTGYDFITGKYFSFRMRG